ncbi:DJ-1 family glyoxalase III [Marinomonas pollencensis]|uniref:4-methyl-5(B-hydroxyethyl)-thiazole monophosphate biosynthesis n=1 Tax=Marinomonas pollencensis TaxID=491954 RepID=A0A3E0DK29_9GAMM|nr:DJ-1 family glyoxalase III [Marinomonas pollencensis]REG82440.1 4-methyl-5(b-hydroxyethyl)-thiazole monophosphate biosynthesis [Marinomonas pollencensis]
MSQVLVPIANGNEEIEAITIIDVLRRGGVDVTVASIHEAKSITGANGCKIEADTLLTEVSAVQYDAIVLPGGMPGAEHLRDCELLVDMLEKHDIQDALLAAICASPALVFGTHGFVVDKQATCYPGFEAGLTGAEYIADQPVVMDDNIITGQGPAAAMTFSLAVLANLKGYEAAQEVANGLLC